MRECVRAEESADGARRLSSSLNEGTQSSRERGAGIEQWISVKKLRKRARVWKRRRRARQRTDAGLLDSIHYVEGAENGPRRDKTIPFTRNRNGKKAFPLEVICRFHARQTGSKRKAGSRKRGCLEIGLQTKYSNKRRSLLEARCKQVQHSEKHSPPTNREMAKPCY